jgi:hypothetical protein
MIWEIFTLLHIIFEEKTKIMIGYNQEHDTESTCLHPNHLVNGILVPLIPSEIIYILT